jgi:hypothetical protein
MGASKDVMIARATEMRGLDAAQESVDEMKNPVSPATARIYLILH